VPVVVTFKILAPPDAKDELAIVAAVSGLAAVTIKSSSAATSSLIKTGFTSEIVPAIINLLIKWGKLIPH
jgi:hypothetical protein